MLDMVEMFYNVWLFAWYVLRRLENYNNFLLYAAASEVLLELWRCCQLLDSRLLPLPYATNYEYCSPYS